MVAIHFRFLATIFVESENKHMTLCTHGAARTAEEHMTEGQYFDMHLSFVQDDEKLNWMVQQWLQERGYVRALKALQEVNAYVFVKIV